MKKSILCVTALLALGTTAAMAEEMTVAPSSFITATVPFLQWSGPYVGVNGGYAFGNSSVSYTPNDSAAQTGTCGGVGGGKCIPSTDFHRYGPLAGGQFGFNWQINPMWLTGVEADYQWSNFSGTGSSPFHLGSVGNTSMIADQSVKSFGTLRVRMGVMPANPLLLYGTAGLAIGQVSETLNAANPVAAGSGSVSSGGFSYLCTAGGPACFAGTSSKTMWGWTAGAGAEYAITTNLTFKTEILYVNLGTPQLNAVAQSTVPGTAPSSFSASFAPVTFVVARAGVNVRF